MSGSVARAVRLKVGPVGLAAVGVVLAFALSCRQIAGITDSAPVDLAPTSTACGLSYGTVTCAACAQAHCCDESSACQGDPVCAAYETCVGNCAGDLKCRAQCALAHAPGTASDVTALSVCPARRAAETECGLTCGALAGWQRSSRTRRDGMPVPALRVEGLPGGAGLAHGRPTATRFSDVRRPASRPTAARRAISPTE